MATLLALFGPKRGVRLELDRSLTVGRSSSVDVQLIDEKVSREHARFAADGASARVEDLGSQNGVYVNGRRISEPTTLLPGDEIAIGDSLFVLDGKLDVATARFGETTVLISPEGAGGEAKAFPSVALPASTSLAAVSALAGNLFRAHNAETAARAVIASLDEVFKPDHCFVLLWDAEKKQVTPLVGKSAEATVPISRTVLELAAGGKLAVVLDDAVEDRDFHDAKSVIRHKLRSVLVAPILGIDVVMGFLHCDRNTRGAYKPDDAALLETFAALVAMHGLLGALPPPIKAERRVEIDGPTGDVVVPPAGKSDAFHQVVKMAKAAAKATSTVLLGGESGTGKEEVARYIHTVSPRAKKPFLAVNCGAIAEALAESELFGHEKGAFTGAATTRSGYVEAADGGTLFLDEVGELSASVQVKLLRVLQERAFYRVGSTLPRRVDVRVIAASHRDLEKEVKAGRFREDLYYRLNVVRIDIPPLRERAEDVPILARLLLDRISTALGKKNPGIASDALTALGRRQWRGNVRELGNMIERLLVLRPQDSGVIAREEVEALAGKAEPAPLLGGGSLSEKVAALERSEVEAAMRKARGIKARAAEMLGISRPTLDKKIADLKIDLWPDKDKE